MVLGKTVGRLRRGTKTILDKTTIDDKLVHGAKAVKKEVRKHIITAITAAFGFLIALAWRDAIAAWVNALVENFNVSEGWYKFVAALIITIIGVAGIILISKLEEKPIESK